MTEIHSPTTAGERAMDDLSVQLVGSDRLLTTEQAAAHLAVPARTLQSWRSKGRYSGPPYVRLSSHVRYRISDLDAWVAERVVGGAA